jgi:hypothetical protein
VPEGMRGAWQEEGRGKERGIMCLWHGWCAGLLYWVMVIASAAFYDGGDVFQCICSVMRRSISAMRLAPVIVAATPAAAPCCKVESDSMHHRRAWCLIRLASLAGLCC